MEILYIIHRYRHCVRGGVFTTFTWQNEHHLYLHLHLPSMSINNIMSNACSRRSVCVYTPHDKHILMTPSSYIHVYIYM